MVGLLDFIALMQYAFIWGDDRGYCRVTAKFSASSVNLV